LIGVAVWGAWLLLRRRPLETERAFLRTAVITAPLGLIAVEAGWMVTELGRQPWIIRDVLRVREALTPMPGLWIGFTITVLVYLLLGAVVTILLVRYVASANDPETGA
jgi:cytochrome bd ubiquinol oxidase subunit I